ncbi:MAG: hypothetical protein Kow0010_19260 [Dehalococcoidia bacterium]
MRALGYFVEGAKRDGKPRSVGEQHQAFLNFCQRHGYEVAATFLDILDDESPESGFRQMLRYLQRADHGFVVVVVDGVGALGPDLGRAALRMLAIEATGTQVFEAASGREVAKEIVGTWADRGEGTPMSERVRSAMRRKAVRGEALGRPPYGYRVGPRRRLELVPEEAVVVRYIFRLYLQEGMGIRRIAGQLNEEGIHTRRGGRWSMVSVRDILRNRVYLGTYSRFGVRIPDSHPALIAADDFRRVQERMESRNRGGGRRTVQPFLLSGLVYCARCGNRMIGVSRRQSWTRASGEEQTRSYRYYQCESRTNQSACGYNTQRAVELEARVRTMVTDDGPEVRRMRRAGNVDSYVLDIMSQVDRIEGRMRRNRRQVEELVADAAHGHITIERMKALGAELALEQQQLEDERREARERLQAQRTEEERAHHLEETRRRLVDEWDDLPFDQLQETLREVIDRIEVDGEDIRLSLRG